MTTRPKMLTGPQRAALYTFRWPERPPLQALNGCIYGAWIIGSDFHRSNPTWGAYPNGFLARLTTVWPELPRLHVFSGGVTDAESTTLDIRPDSGADIIGNVLDVERLVGRGRFATVMADPPYDCAACRVYGTKAVLNRDVLPALARVMKPGGNLLWFDARVPLWSKEWWVWGGFIGVATGTNRRARFLTILRRKR